MSASLVGSEMCIRDSCWGEQGGGHATFLAICHAQCPRQASCPSIAWTRRCLLYTSDAADDM
eukprot:11718443-Alexandrium_andersonii.AAC.1